jgi:hypothetical protein
MLGKKNQIYCFKNCAANFQKQNDCHAAPIT